MSVASLNQFLLKNCPPELVFFAGRTLVTYTKQIPADVNSGIIGEVLCHIISDPTYSTIQFSCDLYVPCIKQPNGEIIVATVSITEETPIVITQERCIPKVTIRAYFENNIGIVRTDGLEDKSSTESHK